MTSLLPVYEPAPPPFVSGTGATLIDARGRSYLDLNSGLGVTALGHSHPRWSAAIADQATRLTHVSNLLRHPLAEEVASRLTHLSGMAAVFFSNSGSEANECALKIARKAARLRDPHSRGRLVALERSFHGRTLGSLSLTARAAYREPFEPLLEVTFVPPGDLTALAEAIRDGGPSKAAALFLEPIQGEGGLYELSPQFLAGARELCDTHGTLLVADEVQSGAGRSGDFLALAPSGIQADIVTLGKPLAGGLPIGATLVSEELAGVLAPGDHGSTFGGGPLVLRGAEVFLEELEEGGLAEAVRQRGAELREGLDRIVAAGLAAERRGRGLMQGLALPGRAPAAQKALFERSLIASTAGGDLLRFLPPYVITPRELNQALDILTQTLEELPA